MKIDPLVRFWSRVNKGEPDECWMWTGGVAGGGYGQFYVSKHEPIGAHRFSWQIANDQPVPAGKHVLHTCDTPGCVNPAHLWVGTAADNMRDKAAKGRNPGNRTNRGRPKPLWTPEVVDAMRKQGMFYREIGKVLGVSGATAYRTHKRLR